MPPHQSFHWLFFKVRENLTIPLGAYWLCQIANAHFGQLLLATRTNCHRMNFKAIMICFVFLFITLSPLAQSDICPRGYWAAEVQSASTKKAINQYSSDRKYTLPYGPMGNTPICRFCPQISCFIMRQQSEKKDSKKESTIRRRPRTHPAHSMTTTPKTAPMEGLFTEFDNATATKSPEIHEEPNIMMSCAPYSDLPFPEQIITYLDCVQIGQRDLYYLFIYTPVNKELDVIPVDCIDPKFLSWIPKREKLKGIELGFPMKRLPPFFFRFYRDIMETTEQVCIDSSSLVNYEIDPHDLQRFDGKVLTQTVYRHRGLKRGVLPPKQPPNTAETGHKSDEKMEECPALTQSGVGRTFSDRDCRYAASEMPINDSLVNKDEAEKTCACAHCTYQKPVIQVTKEERNRLPVPKYVTTLLNMALLALVLLLIFGTVLGFCLNNKDKAMILFLTRTRKRKREREEALAREAAERAAKEAEEQNLVNWNPFLNRYGMLAGSGAMGGFGPFSTRLATGNHDGAGAQFGGQHSSTANHESQKASTRRRR